MTLRNSVEHTAGAVAFPRADAARAALRRGTTQRAVVRESGRTWSASASVSWERFWLESAGWL